MGQVITQRFKIIDQFLFIIGFAQGIEKIIFKVQQVCHDRLLAKFFIGQAVVIIQSGISLYLQTGQGPQAFFKKPIYFIGLNPFDSR